MPSVRVRLALWSAGNARKHEAVWAVLVQGRTAAAVAREMGCTRQLVARWVRAFVRANKEAEEQAAPVPSAAAV